MQKGPWYEGLLDPQEELRDFIDKLQPTITKAFRTFARQAAGGIGAEFDPFEVSAQAWIDAQSFGLIQDLYDSTFATTKQALQKTMAAGWQAGETVNQLAKRVRTVFDQATRHRSYLIARTETTTAANAATLAVWQQAKVPYKQWLTGRDERVCPICGALDGEVVPLSEAFSLGMQGPPAHPACRCSLRACEDPSGVPDFDTLDEATAWAQKRYPHITWEFDGADVEAITPTLRQFHKLAREYPEVARRLRYVGTYSRAPGRIHPGAIAQASRDGLEIGLNPSPDYYGNKANLLQKLDWMVQNGHNPKGCNSIETIITHEFGHQVRNWLRDTQKALLPYVTADGLGSISGTWLLWEQKHYSRRAAQGVSKYAMTNRSEGWAEGFAALNRSPGRLPVYVRRQKVLLETLFERSNWIEYGQWDYLVNLSLSPEDRRRALEAVDGLRKRLEL